MTRTGVYGFVLYVLCVTMTVVSEECESRRLNLDGAQWVKIELRPIAA